MPGQQMFLVFLPIFPALERQKNHAKRGSGTQQPGCEPVGLDFRRPNALIESMLLALPGVAEPSYRLGLALVFAALVVGGLGWAIFFEVLHRSSGSPHDRRGLPQEAPPSASRSSGFTTSR